MKKLIRHRGWIQAAAALLTNANLRGFVQGRIYSGPGKAICVPGLNCYSCPGAMGACPIGALQAVLTGNQHSFSFYVVGTLLLFGVLLGRLICGLLCPFGWIQELLHKLPGHKLRIPKSVDRPLRKLKYGVLLLFVMALPAFAADGFGLGIPWFCKWICPAGTLEGGIPLILTNPSLRAGLGFTFWWKLSLLLLTIVFSMLLYRPFCRYVCPLGAFYSLFNKISLVRLDCAANRCVSCGRCAASCPMEISLPANLNSAECVRCGKCATTCPEGAISFRFGLAQIKEEFR